MLAGRAVSGWCLGVTRSTYYHQQVPQYHHNNPYPGTRCVTPTPPCSGCRPPSPPRMWPRSPSSGPRGGYPRCAGCTPRHQPPSPGDQLYLKLQTIYWSYNHGEGPYSTIKFPAYFTVIFCPGAPSLWSASLGGRVRRTRG